MSNVYDSFLEVPLDIPGIDGDDSVVPEYENVYYEPAVPFVSETLLTAPKEIFVVPYYFMKPGSRGKKVKALNRALSHAGYRKWVKFSETGNPWVTKALKNFQEDYNLPATGIYDKKTHEKMARFYDAYSIKCLLAIPKVSKEQEKRNDFLAELMYIYNRRWNIVYTQRRPFDIWKPPRGLDCSASGEWACKWSNIPSPSGYSGYVGGILGHR